VSPEAAVQALVKNGVPQHVADALQQSYEAIKNGASSAVTNTVERVTGRKPRSYETWVRENAARFA
jgi:(4-alkanoyl-5-oxo-2,5-dihydrofuran-3-yl)methyl phosphate reductase